MNSNYYRGITVSLCLSKLLEMYILYKFQHLFTVSLLHFGFQKELSCIHAISLYAVRSITDYCNACRFLDPRLSMLHC